MKLRSFYFLAVFAGLVSCSDDEPANDTPLLTISTEPGSIGNEVWIFLTREDGTLIDVKEVTDEGDGFVFERPSDFTEQHFVVHELIHGPNSRDFYINSYTTITGGEINYTAGNPTTGLTEVGKHAYTFTEVPAGYYPPLITGPHVLTSTGTGTNGTFSGTTTLGASNSDLVFWFQQAQSNPLAVPRYTLVQDAAVGEALSMSFNDLTPANEQAITFEAQQDFAVVVVQPSSPELPPMPAYSILTWRNATNIKLYYPGEVFDQYAIFIETRIGNDYQEYSKTGSLPTSFKSMPATITSLSQDATRVTITTSGAYDYLITSGTSRWTINAMEYYLNWFANMDDTATKTFTMPALPEAIVVRYPELSAPPLVEFSTVEIRDANNVDNYADFISKLWSTEAFPPPTEFLSRRKVIN
jgi:hypothetical protein